MNLKEFKQKIFTERPDVKKEYDDMEQEYADKAKSIEAEISHVDHRSSGN